MADETPPPNGPDKFRIELDATPPRNNAPASWMDALKELEHTPVLGVKKVTPAPIKEPPPQNPAEAPKAPAPAHRSSDDAVLNSSDQITKPMVDPALTRPTTQLPLKMQELLKKPALKVESEDVRVMEELSNIMSNVNAALSALQKFAKAHPYLVAPNVFRMWEDNLKETSTVMMREFHNMRNGRFNKTYDKRYVCTKCHTVFMVPLPEGLCDECRNAPPEGSGWY